LLEMFFVDKTECAIFPRRTAKLVVSMMAHDDDAGLRKPGLEQARGGEAVHSRHFDVHEHPVGFNLGVAFQDLAAVVAFRDVAGWQKGADHAPELGMIVHDEKLARKFRDGYVVTHNDELANAQAAKGIEAPT